MKKRVQNKIINLIEFVGDKVDKKLDDVFNLTHRKAQTVDGHIFPDQENELTALKQSLVKLIFTQAWQNTEEYNSMTDDEEDEAAEFINLQLTDYFLGN